MPNPSLRHIIIAIIAALHLAHRDTTLYQSIEKQTQGIATPCYSTILTDCGPKQSQSSNEYRDALLHKQKALHYLNNDIRDAFTHNYDATIASILLFIWFETLESGKQTSIYHLYGVGELIRLRNSINDQRCCGIKALNEKMSGVWSLLQDYFDTTYAVYANFIHLPKH